MKHMINLNDVECLVICEALRKLSEDSKVHRDDRNMARMLRNRIYDKINRDKSIELAEEAKDRYRGEK